MENPRDSFASHCLELLSPLGSARAKRMFGGHGLYLDELFIGILASQRLYLKVDAQTEPAFAAAGCEPFVYDGKGKRVVMSFRSVPEEAMDAPALMQPWARLAVAAALRARAAKAAPLKRRGRTTAR